MIKLKYQHLRNQEFQRAMRSIANYKGINDPKAIYNIMRLGKKIEQASKESDEVFFKLVKEYATLDEKGNVKPVDGRMNSFDIPEEKRDEFAKKAEEFLDIEFTVERRPLKLSEIAQVGLSASELNAIEDVLDIEELSSFDDQKPPLKAVEKAPAAARP